MIDNENVPYDEIEDFAAIVNGLAPQRYIDIVNKNGKKKYTPEEENARLRKAVKLLTDLMAINHPEIVNTPEYRELIEYYNDFEGIKAEAKKRLNIN